MGCDAEYMQHKLEQENEKLKADVAMLREVLWPIVAGGMQSASEVAAGCLYCEVSISDVKKAKKCLSATASSDAWMKEQKANVLEEAAVVCDAECDGQYKFKGTNHWSPYVEGMGDGADECATELRRMAAELRSPESDIDQQQRRT